MENNKVLEQQKEAEVRLKIKVCGMKYTSNVLDIDELEPDLMGFIFYPSSPRYLNEDISATLDSLKNVRKTGVFVNSSYELIMKIREHYCLDIIQLHGGESSSLCRQLYEEGVSVIKAFSVDENFDFNTTAEYAAFCDYFLFDTPSQSFGGSGQRFNWNILDNYQLEKGFFLSGGLSPEILPELLQFSHSLLVGYDINSGFELKPGLKNIQAVKHFIREVRNAK